MTLEERLKELHAWVCRNVPDEQIKKIELCFCRTCRYFPHTSVSII
jgi:hypothetical protein